MLGSGEKRVPLVEAARVIYRCREPNREQVERVRARMEAGLLRVDNPDAPPMQWTTSERALAEYLELQARHQQRSPGRAIPGGTPRNRGDEPLQEICDSLLKDYFLAVVMQRRGARQRRSALFERAVLAGQVLLLLLTAGIALGSIRLGFSPPPPERAAIENFLSEHALEHRVEKWHPPEPAAEGAGVEVRVQYSYRSGNRRIHTDRRFLVVDQAVTELPLE